MHSPVFAVFAFCLRKTCSVLGAVCNVQCGFCFLEFANFIAVYWALCNKVCTEKCVECVVGSVQCAVYSVQRAVSCMQ